MPDKSNNLAGEYPGGPLVVIIHAGLPYSAQFQREKRMLVSLARKLKRPR